MDKLRSTVGPVGQTFLSATPSPGRQECLPPVSRRDFLRVGSLYPLGISLAPLLQASRALAGSGSPMGRKAQACILLWLEGGPSQMDTWDPKGNSSLKPVATKVPGIQISELFPRVARHM